MGAVLNARHADHGVIDPIVEQLRQCPEAFKVGEILGKASADLSAQDRTMSFLWDANVPSEPMKERTNCASSHGARK